MYDYERQDRKSSGSLIITLLGRLLLILLFVLILLLLFPTKKSLNPLYQSVFRDNINSMKDAASTYYTNERLPEKVGESKKMTLREMLELKLILPFVDKDSKECDLDSSYVEITKKETEYELKVNLVCPSENAFIIEHLGCTDKCIDCEEKQVKQYEYQFKKVQTQNQLVGYNCPSGYKLSGTICEKEVSQEKIINATAKYEEQFKTADKVCNTTESISCATGFTYNKTTKKCEKKATITKDEKTIYSCPDGGTLSGTNCVQDASSSSVASGTSYSCSSGTLSGKSCYIGSVSTGYSTSTRTSTSPTLYSGETIINTYASKDCSTCSTIRYYTIRKTTSYTYCDSGYKSGSGCYIDATPVTNYETVYSCPSGWTKNGTTCTKSAKSNTSTSEKASCSSGTLNGNICQLSATIKENKTCSCPSTYKEVNGVCTKQIEDKLVGYVCPEGYDKYNTDKCVTYVKEKETTKATPNYKKVSNTVYRWSASPTLSGWTSTGKTREVK